MTGARYWLLFLRQESGQQLNFTPSNRSFTTQILAVRCDVVRTRHFGTAICAIAVFYVSPIECFNCLLRLTIKCAWVRGKSEDIEMSGGRGVGELCLLITERCRFFIICMHVLANYLLLYLTCQFSYLVFWTCDAEVDRFWWDTGAPCRFEMLKYVWCVKYFNFRRKVGSIMELFLTCFCFSTFVTRLCRVWIRTADACAYFPCFGLEEMFCLFRAW